MTYGVFSDVHSNLEAFEAVLSCFRRLKIQSCIFLGDIVGYGADPKACIACLKETGALSIAGNHDRAVADLIGTDDFNEFARRAVVWTKGHIHESDRSFLSGLELVKEGPACCLVHGTLDRPEEFDYMTDGPRAIETFSRLKQKVCFVGHSHIPGVFVEELGKVRYEGPGLIVMERDRRYIVNAGSVGQPRDGNPRACCCIYDDREGTIAFERLEYDVASAQQKIVEAGLPEHLALRLAAGR